MNESSKIVETKYPEEVYIKVKMQNLIVFGIYSVTKNGETCTYERLIAECFYNFPKVFGFMRYPQWPDPLKFDRPLRTLREKGLIVGSVRDRFELTEFGERVAKETESILTKKGGTINKTIKPMGRSADDKLIEFIKKSEPYKRYQANPENFTISESEFRSLLRCTLETPERVLKQNLTHFKKVAESYKEAQIFNFLTTCEKKLIRKVRKDG